MQQQLTRLRGAWGTIPRRAQFAIIAVAAVTLVVLILVLRAASTTTWVTVASDLPPAELGEAETALDEAGIEHQLSESGTSLEVAEADAPQAANALGTAGIAAKGTRAGCAEQSEEGGSLMAKTSAETTLMLETCAENDAANTIENFDGVESATVDATLPGESLFAEDEEPAKAAVTVDTGGNGLPEMTVKGIKETVAGGFDGLKPAMISVVDETGRVLGRGDDEESGAPMNKLEAEAKLNAKIERDLMGSLEDIVGEGNIVLKSNVWLDMDKIRREVVDVEAGSETGEQLVQSENYEKELLNGTAAAGVQGVAGTGTNIGVDPDNRTVTPDVTAAGGGDGNFVGDKNAIIYDNDKVAEAIDVAPGAVLSYKIGAVVDEAVDPAAATAAQNLIQAWMGGNAQDSFSFSQAPIASARPVETPTDSNASVIAGYLKWALLGVGLIGLAFVLRRSLTQRTAELLSPADDMLLLETGEFTPIPIAELEAALAAGKPKVEAREQKNLQRKVEEIADNRPEDVANELRRWLQEEDAAVMTSSMPTRRAS